jgi:hypothetical protein
VAKWWRGPEMGQAHPEQVPPAFSRLVDILHAPSETSPMNCRSSTLVPGHNELSERAALQPPTVQLPEHIVNLGRTGQAENEYSKDFSEVLSEIGEITP